MLLYVFHFDIILLAANGFLFNTNRTAGLTPHYMEATQLPILGNENFEDMVIYVVLAYIIRFLDVFEKGIDVSAMWHIVTLEDDVQLAGVNVRSIASITEIAKDVPLELMA